MARQRLLLLTTAVIVALSRFLARFKTPWDWDEVLFCLAIRDYNVQAHHPHPPGFPLYVALGKIARLFTDTDFHALQAVNFLAAFLLFPLVYRLARAFGLDFTTSYVAALIYAVLPNVWFYGGGSFSDIPALVFFLSAAATYLTVETPRRYLLAAFLFACGLLIRPHSALTMLYPWAIGTWRMLRERRWGTLVLSGFMIAIIAVIGYGAAMYVTGVDEYLLTLRNHAQYVQRTDSVENPVRPPLHEVVRMQLDPFNAGKVSILIAVLALIGAVFGRRKPVIGILLTHLPWFFFVTFSLHWSGFSRHAIPYMAMLVFLAAEGIHVLANVRPRFAIAVHALFALLIVGRFVQWTIPAFDQPRRLAPAPVAMCEWVAKNLDPKRHVLLVHDSMWPWARYFLPEFTQKNVPHDVTVHKVVRTEDEWLLTAAPSQSTRARVFRWQRDRTWNVVAQRYFEVYLQPASDIATFGPGWHWIETDEHATWRWMARRSFTYLPPVDGPALLELELEAHIDPKRGANRVTYTLNDQVLASRLYTTFPSHERFLVPHPRGKGTNVLKIEVEDAMYDPRELSLKLYRWGWRPQ